MSEQQGNTNEESVIALPDFCEFPAERLARGALTEEQLQQASEIFVNILDGLLLEHMEHVHHFEGNHLFGVRYSAKLSGQLTIDGQRYSLFLKDSDPESIRKSKSAPELRDSERIIRSLTLKTIDETGRSPQSGSYRLSLDGVIRRYDVDNSKIISRATADTGYRGISSSIIAEAKAIVDNIRNGAIPNNRLEEDMGLNNQPVSPKELNGLAEFLNKSVFAPYVRV